MKIPLYYVNDYLKRLAPVTNTAPYVRYALNLKTYSSILTLALIPCILAGLWNSGYQANAAVTELAMDTLPGWRGAIMASMAVSHDPENLWSNLILGFLYLIPIFVISGVAALFWESLFASMRRQEISEGTLLTTLLFTLTLPAGIPLWQAAIGISFGIVIGKEIFGGTGMNIVNTVLAGRAFLYFAYPEQISGNEVWTAVDGFSGATVLAVIKAENIQSFLPQGMSWFDAFMGRMQGSTGETSTLACLIGAALLLYTGLVSWRVLTGIMFGMVFTSLFFNWAGSDSNPMFAMPWYWHLVLGGYAFGMVFLATDPVTSAATNPGRWIYGGLIGVLVVIIRITNPVSPEGMMFAILLANIFAPLIDYFVIQANIKRRHAFLNNARYRPHP